MESSGIWKVEIRAMFSEKKVDILWKIFLGRKEPGMKYKVWGLSLTEMKGKAFWNKKIKSNTSKHKAWFSGTRGLLNMAYEAIDSLNPSYSSTSSLHTS